MWLLISSIFIYWVFSMKEEIIIRFFQITDSLNYKSRQRKQNTTGQILPCWLVGTLKANYQPNLSQIKNTIAPIYLNICLVWTGLCLKLGKSLLPLTQFRTTTNPSKTGRSLMVSSRIMIHKRIFSLLPEEERVRGKSSHNWILYSLVFLAEWMNLVLTKGPMSISSRYAWEILFVINAN